MSRRAERVASLLRQELADLLRTEVKDPRLLGMISITQVEVDPDLECAKIFVSSLGGAAEKNEVLQGLSSASGFFRSELAKNLKMRYTPRLEFRWDESIEHGAHILDLLARVKPPDQAT